MNLKEIKLPIKKNDRRIKQDNYYLLFIKEEIAEPFFKTVQAMEEDLGWYFNFTDNDGISYEEFKDLTVKRMWIIPNLQLPE